MGPNAPVATTTSAMMSMPKELPRRHRSPAASRASRALRSDMPPLGAHGQTLRHEGGGLTVRARSDREATHSRRLPSRSSHADGIRSHSDSGTDSHRCTLEADDLHSGCPRRNPGQGSLRGAAQGTRAMVALGPRRSLPCDSPSRCPRSHQGEGLDQARAHPDGRDHRVQRRYARACRQA